MAQVATLTPALRRAITANRTRILAREAAIAEAVRAAFQHAHQSITPAQHTLISAYGSELDALQSAAADDATPSHVTVPMAWARASGHLSHLQRAVLVAVGGFALASQHHITDGQQQAVQAGAQDAYALITTALEPHATRLGLSSPVVDALVRRPSGNVLAAFIGKSLTTGKPLSDLLARMDDATAHTVTRTLYAALASGVHPDQAAQMLTKATGMAQSRALVVARTEIMSAYRSASLTTYRANADVVDGWVWMAAAGACPFCASMDGTLHTLDEDMSDLTHPNCRCCPAPHVKADGIASIFAA